MPIVNAYARGYRLYRQTKYRRDVVLRVCVCETWFSRAALKYDARESGAGVPGVVAHMPRSLGAAAARHHVFVRRAERRGIDLSIFTLDNRRRSQLRGFLWTNYVPFCV